MDGAEATRRPAEDDHRKRLRDAIVPDQVEEQNVLFTMRRTSVVVEVERVVGSGKVKFS